MTLTNAQLAAVITDTLHKDLQAVAAALTPPVPLVQPAPLVAPASGLVLEQSGLNGIPEWDAILGGAGGESGQAYTSHRGTWSRLRQPGGPSIVDIWVHFQFNGNAGGYGSITGPLQVRLPFRTANRPGFFGGVCLHSSNMHQDAAKFTGYTLWCGGLRDSADVYGQAPGANGEPLTSRYLNPNTQLIFVMRYPAGD